MQPACKANDPTAAVKSADQDRTHKLIVAFSGRLCVTPISDKVARRRERFDFLDTPRARYSHQTNLIWLTRVTTKDLCGRTKERTDNLDIYEKI